MSGEHGRGRQAGQATVEFAVVSLLFFFWLISTVQFAIIGMDFYSLIGVTQSTVRWLALHPDTVDSAVLARARGNPGTLIPSRILSATTTPPCPAVEGGRCRGRPGGSVLTVQIAYDVSPRVFIPIGFGLGSISLPPYRASAMVE